MISALMIMFFAFAVFMVWQMKRESKHYAVLFPLRELRGDIRLFLVNNALVKKGVLLPDEYESVMHLYKAVDFAVNDYDRHTTEMFNLHKLAKHMKAYRRTVNRAPREPDDHSEIREFYSRFRYLFAKAFIAYTPLFRTYAVLGFIVIVFGIGGAKLRKQIKGVQQQFSDVREDVRRYA